MLSEQNHRLIIAPESLCIVFVEMRGVLGWVVKKFLGGPWNHVAIEVDRVVYEKLPGYRGFVCTPADQYHRNQNHTKVYLLPKTISNHFCTDRFHGFLSQNFGRKYGWLDALKIGFKTRFPWLGTYIKNSAMNWTCIDMVFEAFVQQGILTSRQDIITIAEFEDIVKNCSGVQVVLECKS